MFFLTDPPSWAKNLFGTGGWVIAAITVITFGFNVLEQRRKRNEELRKYHEIIEPFVREILGDGEYIARFEEIKKLHQENTPKISDERGRYLRDYPAKLEELASKMTAGLLRPEIVYRNFGDQILTTWNTQCLWENEDRDLDTGALVYWKLFQAMAKAMEDERKKEAR